MKEFFKEILNLPWKPNSQQDPQHENQVEDLIKEFGYNYTAQPNGIQKSPDFRIHLENRDVDIECKSTKNFAPMYNGGLPKEGVVYILSSKRLDETTVFFAEDVVTDTKRAEFEALKAELKEVLQKHKDSWEYDSRGFSYMIRDMYTQAGGAQFTNYFTHKDRYFCEDKVLNFDFK